MKYGGEKVLSYLLRDRSDGVEGIIDLFISIRLLPRCGVPKVVVFGVVVVLLMLKVDAVVGRRNVVVVVIDVLFAMADTLLVSPARSSP